MASVFPFAAYPPSAENAPRVATLPYDVMNRTEAARMAKGNPMSFLRVTRSEIELPDDVNPYAVAVYQRATANWHAFVADKTVVKDTRPAFYVYSLVMDGRRQTGIVACASVDDYNRGIVRRHERTRREKEEDRTRHISMLRVQTGPVFLTHRDDPTVADVTAAAMATDPLFDFTADDGIRHTGWRVPADLTDRLAQAFADIPRLYIADGHHRAASAARTHAALVENNTHSPESGRFLAVIFPAGQLRILPYNRLILNLGVMSQPEFLRKMREACTMEPAASPVPPRAGQCCMYFQRQWHLITFDRPDPDASVIDQLDVSILQHDILAPILGIEDPRTSKRIDFVGGIRGTDELERRVDSGEAVAAFSMFPTSLDQLMDIADHDDIMPPKSTWFEPKLRDGLFVHEI